VNRYHFVLRNRYHLFASYYKKLRVMLCWVSIGQGQRRKKNV
jgi:hypothetical protein